MRRRDFVTLVGGAAAWPLAARAQQADRMRRVGALMGFAESDREGQIFIAAFREGLHNLGWTEGRNIRFDTRWAALDAESVQRFAKELVALQPDLILSHVTPTTVALLQQTRTIPIIFVWVFASRLLRRPDFSTWVRVLPSVLLTWIYLLCDEEKPMTKVVTNGCFSASSIIISRILP